jgi:hypothetical protein
MSILDELSSATGEKRSNDELVKRCLEMPALLHTVAEGLRTGTPKARVDCATVLTEVAKRRADLLASFVTDFVDASGDHLKPGGSKKIAKLGFAGLALVVPAQPAEVFAQRDYLMDTAKAGNALSVDAAAVLAALCENNANYRGKLIGALVRLLAGVPDADLPKWVAAIGPAVEGSADAFKRLQQALSARLAALPDAARQKLEKLLVKLERGAKPR